MIKRTLALALTLFIASAGRAHATLERSPFDATTRRYGGVILRVGLHMRVNWIQAVAALAAAMTETNGPNQSFPAKITNPGHGDSSSVGLFQILNIHGSYRERMNPYWASRWWFEQARQQADARRAHTAAGLAQAVEDSAYPSRYAAQVGDAVKLARSLGYVNRDGRLAKAL